MFGKIARGQVKVLENVDNVERRINVGENVSELSRKTFVNITSHLNVFRVDFDDLALLSFLHVN